MPTLTLDRAQAIVGHAENEFSTGKQIDDAFAPFARGGASTRGEALDAIFIVIADFYRMASRSGSGASSEMEEFSAYARLSGSIAMRLASVSISDKTGSQQIAITDNRETVDSFVRFLRTLNPETSNFWPTVYQRIGLTLPAAPQTRPSISTTSSGKKPWWRFW